MFPEFAHYSILIGLTSSVALELEGDDGETIQENDHVDALFVAGPDLFHHGENVLTVFLCQLRIEGIGNSTQENAIVIDTFGGSGSTLMACEQMNRTCCTMELDEKYASVILRRYVDDTGDADGVYVIRNGEKLPYTALVKDVEPAS